MGAARGWPRAIASGLITKVRTSQARRIPCVTERVPDLVPDRGPGRALIRSFRGLMDIPQLATGEGMPAGRWRRARSRRCRWNRRRLPCRRGGWRGPGGGGVVRQRHIDADVTIAEGASAAAPVHIERNGAKRGPRTSARARADEEGKCVARALPHAHLDDRIGRTTPGDANRDVAVVIAPGAGEAAHGNGDGAERAPASALGSRADVQGLGIADALPDADLDVGRAPGLRKGDSRGRTREPQHDEQRCDDPRYYVSPFVSIGTSTHIRSPWIMAAECSGSPSLPFSLFPYLLSGRSSRE